MNIWDAGLKCITLGPLGILLKIHGNWRASPSFISHDPMPAVCLPAPWRDLSRNLDTLAHVLLTSYAQEQMSNAHTLFLLGANTRSV